MATRYLETDERAIPAGIMWDTPRANQGQIIEVSYGDFGRGLRGHGDRYRRVTDRSDGSVTYAEWYDEAERYRVVVEYGMLGGHRSTTIKSHHATEADARQAAYTVAASRAHDRERRRRGGNVRVLDRETRRVVLVA